MSITGFEMASKPYVKEKRVFSTLTEFTQKILHYHTNDLATVSCGAYLTVPGYSCDVGMCQKNERPSYIAGEYSGTASSAAVCY